MRAIVALFVVAAVAAADPRPGDERTHAKAADLVRKLGDHRFAVREAASKQLLEMGGSAVPALIAGTKSDDQEIRNRSIALVPQAKAIEWNRRAEVYLSDKDGKEKHDLPLLAEFEKAIGKPDEGSRKLFAEMVKTSGVLLETATTDRKAAGDAVRARCRTVGVFEEGRVLVKTPIGQLATLFFVHARIGDDLTHWRGDDQPAHLLADPGIEQGLKAKVIGPPLRRLLAYWAGTRPTADLQSHQFFAMLVRSRPFPEAVPALARSAKDKNASMLNVRALAIDALGKIGDQDAKAILEDLTTDTTSVIHGFRDNHNYPLRDLAFAARITADKKNPRDYGLHDEMTVGFRFANEESVSQLTIHAFASDEARQKGLTKWKDESGKK